MAQLIQKDGAIMDSTTLYWSFFYYMCLIEADVILILCHFLPFHTLDSLTVVLIGHLQVPVEVALSRSFWMPKYRVFFDMQFASIVEWLCTVCVGVHMCISAWVCNLELVL